VPDGGAMTRASNLRRRRRPSDRERPQRVYVASPIGTYGLGLYDRQVAAIRRRLPRAKLILARGLFADNEDWRARWPAIVRSIDKLVFFTAPDRTIGLGVFTEIGDALNLGIPVAFLSRRGTLHPLSATQLCPPERPGPRRYVRVSLRADRRAG
jgi:hypothetical protein